MSVVLSILALALVSAPTARAPERPMAIFEPYVGTWSCTEHTDGQPDRVSLFRFELDPALLLETIVVPASRLLPDGDVATAIFAFDPKSRRYVETEMCGNAKWFVSTALEPTDGALHWTDVAAATPLSRWTITLPQRGGFTIESFNKPTDKTPNYRAACKRRQT